jgi:hypothetical protein
VANFLYRMMGAAVLDGSMYEGIEADHRAGRQAMSVVLLASLAAGIGAAGAEGMRLPALAVVAVVALVAWVAWAALILQVGSHYFPGQATVTDLGELLRTIGFAASPGLLLVFGLIVPRSIVFTAVGLWMIAAMIVAIRQALDYQSTARAAAASLAALGVIAAVALGLGLLFGPEVS